MSDQDRPLVKRVLRGDPDAFTVLVRRYESAIVNYIYWIVLNREDALDIAQEAFLKAYLSLEKYNPEFKFSTWLFTIAKNAAIDFLRKSNPAMMALDVEPDEGEHREVLHLADGKAISPEESLVRSEVGKQVGAAVNCLPLAYREVLIMRHLYELAYEEIAEILKLPLGTVKNRLFRARELLRDRLQDLNP